MIRTLSLEEPPLLRGYHFPAEEAYQARNQRQLLALEIETNAACNWRCGYCEMAGEATSEEADLVFLKEVIRQAKDLGAAAVVLSGHGEPVLYSKFRGLVQYIASRDMIPVVKSNLSLIDQALAEFLFRRHASVLGKMDYLQAEDQDRLAGCSGAAAAMQKGLACLLQAGFAAGRSKHLMRLGVSFVLHRGNREELLPFWHYCRRHGLAPVLEMLMPASAGTAAFAKEALNGSEIRSAILPVLDMDRDTYGFSAFPRGGCLRHLYSLYVTLAGDVRPCRLTALERHPVLRGAEGYPYNLQRQNLREVYDSDLFSYIRNIDAFLQGRCGRCQHLKVCIGCRGHAYHTGVSQGKDPFTALRLESLVCFKPGA